MSPYKNFLNAAKEYFNSVPFLKFLLSSYMFVFGLGGLLYLLGVFPFGVANFMSPVGILLMYAGLLLTIIKEDIMTLLITSGIISLGSLIAWIVTLASYSYFGYFNFGSFFYFLIFGAIVAIVLIKSDKFKQMRAQAAARTQPAGVACPKCGASIPYAAGFCPSCGTPKPAPPPPVQPQPAPPVQPQPAPPVQPQPAPPVQPQPESTANKCSACGQELAPGSKFCGKCGAPQ